MNDDNYTTELGGHAFTKEQWEVIKSYADGYASAKALEYDNEMQQQVVTFHRAMGQPVGDTPHPLPADRIPVRVELIREEFIDELLPALQAGDMDACIDILYVTLGLLVEMGIKADMLFDEVQASNMSKLGEDGKAIIAGPNDPDGIFEGRVKKGPNYFKPDLAGLLKSGAANLRQEYQRGVAL